MLITRQLTVAIDFHIRKTKTIEATLWHECNSLSSHSEHKELHLI